MSSSRGKTRSRWARACCGEKQQVWGNWGPPASAPHWLCDSEKVLQPLPSPPASSKREVDQSISRLLQPICFREISPEKLPVTLESKLLSDLAPSGGRIRMAAPAQPSLRGEARPLFPCGGQGEQTPRGLCPAWLPGNQLLGVQTQPDFCHHGTSTLACPTGPDIVTVLGSMF